MVLQKFFFFAAFLAASTSLPAISTDASAITAPEAASLTDKGAYGTENNWIAATTTDEIARMVWLAIHPGQPLPSFQVKALVDPGKGTIRLELTGWTATPTSCDLTAAYAWDPKAYSTFANLLLAGAKPADPVKLGSPDLVTDLLTPTGETLAKKDVALSGELSQNPASPLLHEQAALLLLTLALRENADSLSDPRIAICRACAHLAVAEALQPDDVSFTRKVAVAALLTLAGRETDASPLINALAKDRETTAWAQALETLNKDDWRAVTPDNSYPLLVKILWAQAVARDLGDTLAETYFKNLGDLGQVPDFGRALLTEGNPSAVDIGHEFGISTLQLEDKELHSELAAEGTLPSAGASYAELFKDPVGPSVATGADGKPAVQVIGSALFADTAERHIIAAAWATHFWMKISWGVPEEDKKFCTYVSNKFQNARNERYLEFFLDSAKPSNHPKTNGFTADLAEIPPGFASELGWPDEDEKRLLNYYGWGVPFGTAFGMNARWSLDLKVLAGNILPGAPTFTTLLSLKPDSFILAGAALSLNNHLHVPNTEKDGRALLEKFFPYNIHALVYYQTLLHEKPGIANPAVEDVLRKEAALNPDKFWSLGFYLSGCNRSDDAADAFRQAAAQGNDQVGFANNVDWLVKYDFDHDQAEEGERLAKRAEEIFSGRGIETYIWVLCRQDKWDEAENLAKQEEDRYGGGALAAFYGAHPDHFKGRINDSIAKLYPEGFPTVKLSNFTNPPKNGCLLASGSPELTKAGLKPGDVVVALDSHPVYGQVTYTFVRAMSDSPEMDLIVWSGDQYREVKASPPNRRFGNSITDYKP